MLRYQDSFLPLHISGKMAIPSRALAFGNKRGDGGGRGFRQQIDAETGLSGEEAGKKRGGGWGYGGTNREKKE